ncbi:MAG: hypothetical protein OCC45_15075 [Desulfotalea sp.]
MFYGKHVLKQDWQWLDIVKPPKVKSIPDILTPIEISKLICATNKLRYRVFLLATYSMGLRLTEALAKVFRARFLAGLKEIDIDIPQKYHL